MNILAKRIPSILGLVILIAGLAGGAILVRQRQQFQPRAAAGGEPIDLAVSNISDQSFSVSWTTAEAVAGRIQMEEKWINDVRDTQAKMTESKTHFVTVGQLAPGTEYEFKVESGGGLYDSQGKPFRVTTAVTLTGSLPASDVAQGLVKTNAGEPAGGAIVYAQLPGGQLLSAITTISGNWVIPLSTTGTADLSGWLSYDLAATVYTIRADGGKEGKATATVTTGIDQPVPPITLGQSYDFRQSGGEKEKGKRKKEEGAAAVETRSSLRSMFNFEDLGPVTAAATDVTLLNPSEEGEKISTTKPKFFGEGLRETQINITIESPETVKGNVMVGDDGKWGFAAPSDLAAGKHTVTLTWTDGAGVLQTLKRSFIVQAASGEPAFTASPSAVPTKKLTPTPTVSPKKIVPAADSQPPKSGGLTPSVMLVIMGILLISGGRLLLKSEILNIEIRNKF